MPVATWLGDFLYHISPAVSAVVLGAVISGILINRFFVRRANVATLVERVCDRLDRLQEDAGEYWCVDFDSDNPSQAHILEAKIKAHILQINAMSGVIARKHGSVPDSVRQEILNLQDACTGGTFETVARKSDRTRYLKILASINRVAVALQQLKL